MPDPSGPPDFFTVEEAARILRIGRTAAYDLARKWRATDGREGLPVVVFGRLLRVPRAALEEISGGPLVTGSAVLADTAGRAVAQPAPAPAPPPLSPAGVHRRSGKHSRPRPIPRGQSTLPFN
jgi:hypothetical protein